MTNIAFFILAIIAVVWFYSIISIISSTFKNKQVKVFWLIAVIFVPLLSFFYIFLKNNLIEKES